MTTTSNYASTHHRDVGIGIYRSRNEKGDINRKHNSNKHYKNSTNAASSSTNHNNSNNHNNNNNMSSSSGGGGGGGGTITTTSSSRERESERLERKRDWRYDESNMNTNSSSSSSRNINKLERRDAHRYQKYHEENVNSRDEEYHYHHLHSHYHNSNNNNNQQYQKQQQQQHGTLGTTSSTSGNYYNQDQQQPSKISSSTSSISGSKNSLNHHHHHHSSNNNRRSSLDDYAMNEVKMLELKAYANEKKQQKQQHHHKHRKLRIVNNDKIKLPDEQTEHDLRSRLLSKRHKFMKSTHEDDEHIDKELHVEKIDIKIKKQQLQQQEQQQISLNEHNNILELQRERILLRNLLKGTYSNNEDQHTHHHHHHNHRDDLLDDKDRNRERDKTKEKEKMKRIKRAELISRANNKIITHFVDALSPAAVAASVTAGLKDLSKVGPSEVITLTTTTTTTTTTTSSTSSTITTKLIDNTTKIKQHKLSYSKKKNNNNHNMKNESYEIVESLSDMETDPEIINAADDNNSEKNSIINENNNNNNNSKLRKQKKKKKKKKKRKDEHYDTDNDEHSDMDIVRLHDDNDDKKAFVLSDDSNEPQLQQQQQQQQKPKRLKQKHFKQLNEINNVHIEKSQIDGITTVTAPVLSISSDNSISAASQSSSASPSSVSTSSSSSSSMMDEEEIDDDNNTNSSYMTPKTKHKHKKHRQYYEQRHYNRKKEERSKRHKSASLTASENETAYKSETSCKSLANSCSHSCSRSRSCNVSSRCTHSATESDIEMNVNMKKIRKIEKNSIIIDEKTVEILIEKNDKFTVGIIVDKEQQQQQQQQEHETHMQINLISKCDIIDADENLSLPNYFPGVQGCRSVEEFQCLNRIEEGTYGVVYRAKDKRTNEVVALKRLKMEKEKEGFPITSLREINTLLKGQHPNIVTVREIVVGSNMDKIFIVMDYVEHDLKSLMETMKQRKQNFLPSEVKCLIQQLLRAVAHLHDNWILHRDLKTSNLLLSHKGILKVGDFGLAREYGSPLKHYTLLVVTLWYRAPELLLCSPEYSTPIDMWSVGCIFAELLLMRPLFTGESEIDQLNRIFKELGTPNEDIWPGFKQLPAVKNLLNQNSQFTEFTASNLRKRFGESVSDIGIQLLHGMLTYDPSKRLTAEIALRHSYFTELPLPIDPSMFPTWPAKSELGARKSAHSPKPPSGGSRHIKRQEETNLLQNQNKVTNSTANTSNSKILSGIITGNKKSSASSGFVLNAGIEQRQYTARSGFNSKF